MDDRGIARPRSLFAQGIHRQEIPMRKLTLATAAVLLAACSTFEGMMGAGTPAPTRTVDGVLTNTAGMSLYTFDRDVAGSGKSVCNGQCAALWPPLMAAADSASAGDYAIVTRDDGSKQWAYKGKPLYLWVKDTKPGDRTGDGVNNVWRLARP
jgi:predicted lipoprotein with Yx(FWY)xxD motif